MKNLFSNSKSLVLFLITILVIYGWQDITPNNAFGQTGVFVPKMANVDEVFSKFMNNWDIPGGSIAIVKDGRLVYARGFGYANKESNELMKPDHLLRIASVSKPITSIAIMKLIDEGEVTVDAKVFGTDGILNGPSYKTIVDPRVKNITVSHLLHHTSGWGFINKHSDPMFLNQHIARQMGEPTPVGPETIIKFMLTTQRLNNEPGANYFYSNFGFCILGRIIEQVSGKSYENYVQTELLNPLGISEMQLGQNLYENKAPNEVKYYDFPGAPLVNSVYGIGAGVPFPYGGFNIEAMDSHGGWIASVIDLVRLLVAVDGVDTKPDILNQAAIQLMTTPSTANSGYGMGWAVNPWGNWWHVGDLPGTSSILVRTSNGLGWAVLFNTRSSNSQGFIVQMDNMVWEAIKGIDNWPTHDLFEQATTEAKRPKASRLSLSDVPLSDSDGSGVSPQLEGGQVTEPSKLEGDVNNDSVVNIQDLVLVASKLGETGQNAADVNGDGVVDIRDLVKVAGALGNAAAAPSLHPQLLETLTAGEVRQWLFQAQYLNLADVTSQRGIRFLEQLLAMLIPKESALLPNYPNPFNPETWIPYQLSEPAAVTITIYAANGRLLRTFALGHQPAGMYHSKNRAVYWDGRNNFGERVASSVYFYTLTAGNFTTTRKMLIRK